jgi:Spy/CpxP family protein refolding chaperone
LFICYFMIKTLAILSALALATAAHAQTTPSASGAPLNNPGGARSPEQQTQAQAARLAKELTLSSEQETQVQQLLATQRQETQTAIQRAGSNRRAMGQAMRAGRDKFDGQLKAVLTADQYTHYQQLMAERRELMRERRQGRSTGDLD